MASEGKHDEAARWCWPGANSPKTHALYEEHDPASLSFRIEEEGDRRHLHSTPLFEEDGTPKTPKTVRTVTPKTPGSRASERDDSTKGDSFTDTHSTLQGVNIFWHIYGMLIITDRNPIKPWWNLILFLMLSYTGTIFPYRFCFIHLPNANQSLKVEDTGVWVSIELFIDILWWVDLVLNFFFSITDDRGQEVTDPWVISRSYLCGFFMINLLCCLPVAVVRPVVIVVFGTESRGVHHIPRLMRLQRMSRLVRLVQLVKVIKVPEAASKSIVVKKIQGMRGIRIFNFTVGLFFIIHILACGWFVVAELDRNVEATWLNRRSVGKEDKLLKDAGPELQWLHSMYWVLTVFTTVGFGDIYPVTPAEITYACFTMLSGTVLHSMVVSEMINVLTSIDAAEADVSRRRALIKSFVKHTQLTDTTIKAELKEWIDKQSTDKNYYDREAMRSLLAGGNVPTTLMHKLPDYVYGGHVKKNLFTQSCLHRVPELPPRLPVLIALAANQMDYVGGEVVYQMHEHPWNMYMVMKGTFAHVGRPSRQGGNDGAPCESSFMLGNAAKLMHNFSAMRAMLPIISAMQQNQSLQCTNVDSTVSASRSITASRSSECGAGSVRVGCARTSSSNSSSNTKDLYPYRLMSACSYFGEFELFHKSLARRSTVRCETPAGSLLVIHARDIRRIMEEFPHFATLWVSLSKSRELHRVVEVRRLNRPTNFEGLAVRCIQNFIRRRRKANNLEHMKQDVEKVRETLRRSARFGNLVAPNPVGRDCDGRNTMVGGEALKALAEELRGEMRAGFQELQREMRNGFSTLHIDHVAGEVEYGTLIDERRLSRLVSPDIVAGRH